MRVEGWCKEGEGGEGVGGKSGPWWMQRERESESGRIRLTLSQLELREEAGQHSKLVRSHVSLSHNWNTEKRRGSTVSRGRVTSHSLTTGTQRRGGAAQ